MKIKIYQIALERDENGVMFMGLNFVKKHTGTDIIDLAIYDMVFDGEIDCDDLEDVFYKFNMDLYNLGIQYDYHGRSLSVSDIVEIIGDDGKSEYWYCDDVGFTKVNIKEE